MPPYGVRVLRAWPCGDRSGRRVRAGGLVEVGQQPVQAQRRPTHVVLARVRQREQPPGGRPAGRRRERPHARVRRDQTGGEGRGLRRVPFRGSVPRGQRAPLVGRNAGRVAS